METLEACSEKGSSNSTPNERPKIVRSTKMPSANKHRLPTVLYIPNLMGYARILLAFVGLATSTRYPIMTAWIWLASASLDLFDGMVARYLDQCSQLGVLLDIAADNLLRTSFWMAAAVSTATSDTKDDNSILLTMLIATLIVSLEWITMICTQLHAATAGDHWKQCRGGDPWWVQAIFANNFKTPLGALCIGGLFGSGFMAYAQTQAALVSGLPFFFVLRNLAFLGRGITMIAEVWLCGGYLSHVIAQDQEKTRSMGRRRDSNSNTSQDFSAHFLPQVTRLNSCIDLQDNLDKSSS